MIFRTTLYNMTKKEIFSGFKLPFFAELSLRYLTSTIRSFAQSLKCAFLPVFPCEPFNFFLEGQCIFLSFFLYIVILANIRKGERKNIYIKSSWLLRKVTYNTKKNIQVLYAVEPQLAAYICFLKVELYTGLS